MKGVIMTVSFSPEMDQVYIRTGNANLTFFRSAPSCWDKTIRLLSMIALWLIVISVAAIIFEKTYAGYPK
jgi:hypothetical protein